MSYLVPSEFVTKMVDAGESKIYMATRDALIRAYMAGAILAIAAVFAVTVNVQTGSPILGAALFPVGFCILYLMGFDLLTGVFMLTPLAWMERRPGVTWRAILKHWGIVFVGNFLGALTVALLMAIVFTYGFSIPPGKVGEVISHIGEDRTLGVVGAMISTTVSGKVIAMWMPIMLFFFMGFEHSVVNMFLFPSALIMGGNFSIMDYLVWNEIPVVLGNLVGGISLTGLTLYTTHMKTAPRRRFN